MEDENKVTEVRTKQVEPGREGRITTYKATQFIWLLFGILEALLGLRFLLKLIGANPSSPIVSLIYSITGFFLEPFKGLIASPTTGNIVLEISTLIAMLIYGLIGWALERLVWLIFYRPRGSTIEVTQTKSHESSTHNP